MRRAIVDNHLVLFFVINAIMPICDDFAGNYIFRHVHFLNSEVMKHS